MLENPLGIASFSELRRNGCFYADKTGYLYRLLRITKPYFLSRPRRFGKTLLMTTLEEILRGRRELFKGLRIDGSDYDWTPNPVIHLSMAGANAGSEDRLETDLYDMLREIAADEGLALHEASPGRCLAALIHDMRAKYGRLVAVLIDEYDAPILARLSDKDLAEKIRDAMGDFYNALKAAETSRGFTLVTGITRFARTSVFSKLNNPVDLTLNAGYAGICGLTLEDLDLFLGDQLSEPDPRDPQGRPKRLLDFISRGYFPPGASEDDLKSEILERYDGYSWDGETRVLNPWSVFSVFDQDDFSDFWLNTGQPRFLSELAPEDFRIHEIFKTDSFLNDSLNSIDVGSLAPVAILFQTGYLTVASREVVEKTLRYYMRFPNREVETAAYRLGLGLKEREAAGKTPILRERAHALLASLTALDPAGVQAVFGAILASLPYNIHSPNEGYCKTVFLLTLGAAGQRYESESMSGDGIADVVIRTAGGSYYVIEFKYVKNTDAEGKLQAGRFRQRMEAAAKKALSQIEGRKYAWKFKGRGRDIWKVALVVGRYSDTLAVFEKAAGWRLEQGPGGDFTVVME